MDERKKQTLDLIEVAAETISRPARNKQLLYVVHDYAEDGDLAYARKVLGRIDTDYFETTVYEQASVDTLFAEVVADLIEIFGLGFSLLARPITHIN